MAKVKISEFSSTAGNNTDIDGINLAEGMAPSLVNDAIRELMAQLKDFQTGAVGDSFNGPIGTSTAAAGAFTTLSASSTTTLSGLTASTALALDASKNVVSVTNTGTGSNVLATSPTLVTPILGTPTSATLTNATGLPIATGVSGLGTGVATALAVNVGSAGAPVVNGGALGTPSSGTVTNLTGTASININGTVGATTPTTGAFTTLAASGAVTLSGGTANGVTYLNGSKVLTSGSALAFDGTNLSIPTGNLRIGTSASSGPYQIFYNASNDAYGTLQMTSTGFQMSADFSSTGGYKPLLFYTNGSEQMRLTSTGLGIGTSSPATKIDARLSGTSSGAVVTVGNTGSGPFGGIAITDGGSYPVEMWASALVFKTGNSSYASATERARIDSSGNVGIGTSSPDGLLTLAATNSNTPRLRFQHPSNDADASIDTYQDGGGTYLSIGTNAYQTSAGALSKFDAAKAACFIYFDTTGAILSYTATSGGSITERTRVSVDGTFRVKGAGTAGSTDAVQFSGSAPASALALDSAGNLGLGVTPSAWASGYKVFDIGNGAVHYPNSASQIGVSANAYFNSGWIYKSTANATLALQNAGQHIWYTAPSGTAGNAISFTQAATLTASGDWLVGTTSTTASSADYFLYNKGGAYGTFAHANGTASGTGYITFLYNATQIGSITQNGTTAVAYNTSSDYRLKNITGPITNSGAYIDSLNPVEGTWKTDGSTFVGLIAHEVQEASRTQVATGTKDGSEMQAMDYSNSELIANLIAEVKSLRQRVATLEAQ